MSKSKKGYVYVLTNPAMPGYVKIGRSIYGGQKRASQLYQTGVPMPFDLHFEMIFENAVDGELMVHEYLQDSRHKEGREFFSVTPEDAANAVVRAWAAARDLHLLDSVLASASDEVEYLSFVSGLGFTDVLRSLHLTPIETVHASVAKHDNLVAARMIKRLS